MPQTRDVPSLPAESESQLAMCRAVCRSEIDQTRRYPLSSAFASSMRFGRRWALASSAALCSCSYSRAWRTVWAVLASTVSTRWTPSTDLSRPVRRRPTSSAPGASEGTCNKPAPCVRWVKSPDGTVKDRRTTRRVSPVSLTHRCRPAGNKRVRFDRVPDSGGPRIANMNLPPEEALSGRFLIGEVVETDVGPVSLIVTPRF